MTPFTRLAVLALVACAHAQYAEERAPRYIASEPKQQAAPPVAILKQINSNPKSEKAMENPQYLKEMQEFMAIVDKETKRRFNRITEERTRRLQGQGEGRWKSPKLKYNKQRPKDGKPRSVKGAPGVFDVLHNEDGSYTYGYEAADGSFKIETKSPAGDVKGKYGYKDDTGKVRVIEYGANKYGFQPAGEGITVAPPTLVDETTREEGLRPGKSQAGRSQYRPAAQAVDYDYEEPAPAPRPAPRPAPQYRAQQAPAQQAYRPPVPSPPAPYRAPAPTQQPQFRPAPQQQYRPAQSPAPPKPAFFAGAAPVPAQDNFFNPQPQQQRQYKAKQDFRPAAQFEFAPNPKPQIEYSQDYSAPTPKRQPQYTKPYSMLDELLKEYELPSNGAAPLHDITFGSY